MGRLVALAEIAPLFKTGNSDSAMQFLIFSPLYELVTRDIVSYYLNFKLNRCQHDFSKSNSKNNNLTKYLDLIKLFFGYQCQVAVTHIHTHTHTYARTYIYTHTYIHTPWK